jgi:hypothetical protein
MRSLHDADEIFLRYAISEGARATRQFQELRRLLSVRTERQLGVVVYENESVFDALRAALQFTGNISKVFWPPARHAKARGAHLCTMVDVDSNHILARRDLRNDVEHMDERLDLWTASGPRPCLQVEMVLLAEIQGTPGETQMRESVLMSLDPVRMEVSILGRTHLLDVIETAVVDLTERCAAAYSRHVHAGIQAHQMASGSAPEKTG